MQTVQPVAQASPPTTTTTESSPAAHEASGSAAQPASMEGELHRLQCRSYWLFTCASWKRRHAVLRDGHLHLYDDQVSPSIFIFQLPPVPLSKTSAHSSPITFDFSTRNASRTRTTLASRWTGTTCASRRWTGCPASRRASSRPTCSSCPARTGRRR